MKLEKTRLKLSESQEGKLIGFVSRHGKKRKLFGVREDSPLGKKVCVLSEHLKGQLKPDKLYEVSVKPMRSGTGYVIVTAEPILFPVKIEVAIEQNAIYKIALTQLSHFLKRPYVFQCFSIFGLFTVYYKVSFF